MPQILELAHLVQDNGMSKMEIRRRGIQSQFDSQRFARLFGTGEFLCKFGFDQQFVTTSQSNCHRFPDGIGQGQFLHGLRRGNFFVHLTYLRQFVLI